MPGPGSGGRRIFQDLLRRRPTEMIVTEEKEKGGADAVILTLAGAGVIVAGCFGLGLCLCRDMQSRIKELRAYAMIFSLLEGETEYARETLPEAFVRTGVKMGGREGGYFERIGRYMQAEPGVTLACAFSGIMEEALCSSRMNAEEKELLLSFPAFTGFMDGQTQLRALRQFREELENRAQEADTRYKSSRRAVFSLCMAGGFFLVILLL